MVIIKDIVCRICKRTFTKTRIKYSENKKLKSNKNVFKGIGIRSIERLESVSNSLILKWIKKIEKTIEERIIR
jgi:transposase-like protein